MRTAIVSLSLLVTTLGCSSAAPGTRSEVPPAASAGDESTPAVNDAAPEPNDTAPEPHDAARSNVASQPLEPSAVPRTNVQLDVRVNGRSQPGAIVQLLRNGEVVAEMKSGAPPAPIAPGRYEADVLLKGAKIRVKGLQFPEGGTQIVPVNVRF
jgi:hypothetical protein